MHLNARLSTCVLPGAGSRSGSPWDSDLLGSMMQDLQGLEYPLELTGFDALELGSLLGPAVGNIGNIDPGAAAPEMCPTCGRFGARPSSIGTPRFVHRRSR